MYYSWRYNKSYTPTQIYKMSAGEIKLLSYFAKIELEEKTEEMNAMRGD